MFIKKNKEKLHKFLFPEFNKKLEELRGQVIDLVDDREESQIRHQREQDELRHEVNEKTMTQPLLADLMRENLGIVKINFSNVPEDGIPNHFLDVEDQNKRTQYINELHQIFQFEVFHAMCQNHIDTQGNFSFRTADGELQMLAGRMTVNGISLIRNDVRKGHEEYMERSKPKEDFDEFETTEGIIIKKDE